MGEHIDMSKSATEKYALQEALALMGEFGWPTLVLGIICGVGYITTPWMVLQGQMSLMVGVLVMAVCVYAVYTVMHDSVHELISLTAAVNIGADLSNSQYSARSADILHFPLPARRPSNV